MNLFFALTSVASLYLSAVAYTHNRTPSERQDYPVAHESILYKIELEKEDTRTCAKNSLCAEIVYSIYDVDPMKRIEQKGCHCPEGTECWFHDNLNDCFDFWCQVRKEYLLKKSESSFRFFCKEVTCKSVQSQKNKTQEETIFNVTPLYQNETDDINNETTQISNEIDYVYEYNETDYMINETDHTSNETVQSNNGLANMTSPSRNKTSCFSEEETQFENITAQYEDETIQLEDEPTPLTVKHLVWKVKVFIQKMEKFMVGLKQLIWKRRERMCQLENETPHLNTTQLRNETAPSVANEMQDLANRTKELVSGMKDFSLVVTKLIEIEKKKV